MRNEVLRYLKDITRTVVLPVPIIDFGGALVEEQDKEFRGAVQSIVGPSYKTFDLRPEADICGDIHNTQLPSESVGTALILETLEHLAYPQTAFTEMARVLIKDGLLIVTTLMCWEEHRYPSDFWRFLPDGIIHLFISTGFKVLNVTTDNIPTVPSGIFAYGVRL